MKNSRQRSLYSLIDILFVSLFAAAVLAVGICIYALPRQGFSEQENRSLADLPSLSASSLGDGSFFTSLSDFYADNIPLRQYLIRGKALCELALGRQQNNGVIFTGDGRQTDTCRYQSTKLLEENLDAICRFSSSQPLDSLCVFVPRSIDLLSEGSEGSEGSEESRRILRIVADSGAGDTDLTQNLTIDDYYTTDHHLTALGAYKVYRVIAESLGVQPYAVTDFDMELASDSFLGSTYSRSGLLATSYDSVYLPRYAGDTDLTVACCDTGCALNSLYERVRLDTKDKYSVFLGGNHGMLTVTDEGADKPRLLLIKDSFANAVIPFLARHFDLTVIDPRYSNAPLDGLVSSRIYDKTVILCGIDTLATNGAFKRLFVSFITGDIVHSVGYLKSFSLLSSTERYSLASLFAASRLSSR